MLQQSTLIDDLARKLGTPRVWKSKSGREFRLWIQGSDGVEVIACGTTLSEGELRRAHSDRRGRRTAAVVTLCPSLSDSKVRIAGPIEPLAVRDLDGGKVVGIIEKARTMSQHRSAVFIEKEFRRLEESVVPGVRVKDLLTPYFVRERLLEGLQNKDWLAQQTGSPNIGRRATWRTVLMGLGYKIKQLPGQGYLLTHNDSRVAVVHPKRSVEQFSRIDDNGKLPEGELLLACRREGTAWGLMACGLTFRLFEIDPDIGSAASRFLEIDLGDVPEEQQRVLGILSPAALAPSGGRFKDWVMEARQFGEDLRQGLETRLRDDAMPLLAKGLGRYLEQREDADLSDRDQLAKIEETVLTLVFRFMFLLHVEARDYLPVASPKYRVFSATELARDCHTDLAKLDGQSTQLWDRLTTLIRMMRNGLSDAGVPQYNGSLFAEDGFPGSKLLERASITDDHLAPALWAIAYDPKTPESGLDYATLQIGHLGAIYESLLARRLVRANGPLVYDSKKDSYRPCESGDKPEVKSGELFYQNEVGGRKQLGVYYTRHEFVRHLLNHSLRPGLKEHLDEVSRLRLKDHREAAKRLFEFYVVDPAMGSGHFLTMALDMMADMYDEYLAEHGGFQEVRDNLQDLRAHTSSDQAIEDVDLLRRLILKRCIYGVDISPMAVEIANVTLWLASFVPGLALSYLGSNLKCGDALIGVADPDLVLQGGDHQIFQDPYTTAINQATALSRELASISDSTADEVAESEAKHKAYAEVTEGIRRAFDMWTAEPLGVKGAREHLLLHADTVTAQDGSSTDHEGVDFQSQGTAKRYQFLHWTLEFPHVFSGRTVGFDVVVGNPPWNEITVEKLRFYLQRHPGLRGIKDLAKRQRRISEIDESEPNLQAEFLSEQVAARRARDYFRLDGAYVQRGPGDPDLYRLFGERYGQVIKKNGHLGVILPRTAFNNDGLGPFRQWLFRDNIVTRVDFLENKRRWAFDMEPRYTIALLAAKTDGDQSTDGFTLTGPSRDLSEFARVASSDHVRIDVGSLNSSLVLPIVTTRRQVSLIQKLALGPEFGRIDFSRFSKNSVSGSSRVSPHRELDETNQKHLFTVPEQFADTPVWKGRSFGQYNPHGMSIAGCGNWEHIAEALQAKRASPQSGHRRLFSSEHLSDRSTLPLLFSRVAFRHLSSRTNSRTIIACLVPPRTPLTNSAPYFLASGLTPLDQASILAIMNSITFDWLARRFVEINVNFFLLNLLCFPPPDNTPWESLGRMATRLSCVDDRFSDFSNAVGVDFGPQPERTRNELRAEIDALVARSYGLSEDELVYQFEDFSNNALKPDYRDLVVAKFKSS